MSMTKRWLLGVMICLMASRWLSADEPVFSGPQAGERLPPLHVTLAYGRRAGKTVELVSEAGDRPAMLVIVKGANRPAARLTRVLLNYAEMQNSSEFYAALVWLDDDRSAAEKYLQSAVSWWGVGVPVGVSTAGGEGPGSFGLNRNVNLTVLISHHGRVKANFALVQPSETDATQILPEVVALNGGRVPTRAEITFLSIPTRKPSTAPWPTASKDVMLRKRICSLLAAPDEESAAAAAAELTNYVGQDADRQQALTEVAQSLRRGRTRIGALPAVKHLRTWADEDKSQN